MGSLLSCVMCSHQHINNSKVNPITANNQNIFLAIRFPTENQVELRFPVFIGNAFILPGFIVRKIQAGRPFEVSVYEQDGANYSSFFYLPSSFHDEGSYKINHVDENIYDITPMFQQRNPEGRLYDVWLRLFDKDGAVRPIAFMVNKNLI